MKKIRLILPRRVVLSILSSFRLRNKELFFISTYILNIDNIQFYINSKPIEEDRKCIRNSIG